MIRALASFYTEQDKPFCEDLQRTMTICIVEIERTLKEDDNQ